MQYLIYLPINYVPQYHERRQEEAIKDITTLTAHPINIWIGSLHTIFEYNYYFQHGIVNFMNTPFVLFFEKISSDKLID